MISSSTHNRGDSSLRLRRELEEYLDQGTCSQEHLASMLGHEMKTPVQAILTYSELLQSSSDSSRDEYVKAIQRNASRLRVLLGNLSDLAKIDAGTMSLKRERFDLGLLAMSISDDYRNILRAQHRHGVEIFVRARGSIFVNADMERISQVILNLLDNAAKFTSTGSISIEIENDAEHATFRVTDTGQGIDSDIMPILFSKFATSHGSCTGFGLYICKNIVEAHGGRISAKSTHAGATFAFSIPILTYNHKNCTKFLNSERM